MCARLNVCRYIISALLLLFLKFYFLLSKCLEHYSFRDNNTNLWLSTIEICLTELFVFHRIVWFSIFLKKTVSLTTLFKMYFVLLLVASLLLFSAKCLIGENGKNKPKYKRRRQSFNNLITF